jgi:hypothetical protein
MVANLAHTRMATRLLVCVVTHLAQSIASGTGQHGQIAALTVEQAVSLASTSLKFQHSTVVASANMWIMWCTRVAMNIPAQSIAKVHGVLMATATRSALIAATVVLPASRRGHIPSLLKPSMAARNATTHTAKPGSRLATSTAVLRIVKAPGQSLVTAPQLAAMA